MDKWIAEPHREEPVIYEYQTELLLALKNAGVLKAEHLADRRRVKQ